jgi:hypothetical protein
VASIGCTIAAVTAIAAPDRERAHRYGDCHHCTRMFVRGALRCRRHRTALAEVVVAPSLEPPDRAVRQRTLGPCSW